MKIIIWIWILMPAATLFCSMAHADTPTVAEVTHWEFQAVDEDGVSTYSATDKVTVTGIVLNNPEEMLDPTPAASGIGGQWQIFVQGETDPNGNPDHAGTAVWFGQNYGVMGSTSYTPQKYLEELYRINVDPQTGYLFQAGDRVRVTGYYRFFGGKLNINEKHQSDDMFNFEIELITPGVGLPAPSVLALSDLKYTDINHFDEVIFDPSRLTGPEYYQARLVRINNVEITNPENWGPGQTLTIEDENGLTFPVRLGIGHGFLRYPCPEGPIDVIGIMNQESGSGSQGMTGYQIWVVNYDGNGLVLTDRGRPRGNLPGDLNGDFKVNLADLADLAENWLVERAGFYLPPITE